MAAADVDLAPGARAVVPTGGGHRAARRVRGVSCTRGPGWPPGTGVTLVNAPGTVDAGYRGEIRVTLLNTDPATASLVPAGATASRNWSSSGWQHRYSTRWTACPGQPGGENGFGSTGGHASAATGGRVTGAKPRGQQDTPMIESRENGSVPSASPRGKPSPSPSRTRHQKTRRTGQQRRKTRLTRAISSRPGVAGWGPWDAAGDVPAAERVDFGSLQVPVAEGFEIQLNIADDQGPLIAVVRGGQLAAAAGVRRAEERRALG